MTHSIKYRIYFEDTDAHGVVYHGNYLNFCERGRTEFLRACGYTNMKIVEKHNILFVVRHINADYLKPLYLEDEITVETLLKDAKNTSMIMRQIIRKDDEIIFAADVTLVCVDKNTIQPTRIPADIKEAFITHGS
jgi:acyl-CoA thioester hydrolase